MTQLTYMPPKDPNSVEPYFVVWCSKDGTNDGGANDTGELQGATISTVTWTVPNGITKDSDNKSAVTVHGVTYEADTVCTIWLSGGSGGSQYSLSVRITTSDSRTLDKTIVIPVVEQ